MTHCSLWLEVGRSLCGGRLHNPYSDVASSTLVAVVGCRIFGLPPKHFFGKHYLMLSALREQLAPAGLRGYGETLQALAEEELQLWPPSGQVCCAGSSLWLASA